MPAPSYLRQHPRTGIWWFRRAVPPALRPHLAKCEIVYSLKTQDSREARRLAMIRAIEVEALFAQAEGRDQVAGIMAISVTEPQAASLMPVMIGDRYVSTTKEAL